MSSSGSNRIDCSTSSVVFRSQGSWAGNNLGCVVVQRKRVFGPQACYHLLVEAVAGNVAEAMFDEEDRHGYFLDPEERASEVESVKYLSGETECRVISVPHVFSSCYSDERQGLLSLPPEARVGDYASAVALTEKLHLAFGHLDPVAFLRKAERDAELILKTHWNRVRRLATTLARRKKKSMSYREVCHFLGLDPADPAARLHERTAPARSGSTPSGGR